MQTQLKLRAAVTLVALSFHIAIASAGAFEGRLSITLTRGGETQALLYTVGTNQLHIECSQAERPYAKNIVNLETGALTLLFPHNRSFVRLKDAGVHAPSPVPVSASFAGVGPGAHPNAPDAHALAVSSKNIDGTNLQVMPPMPQMPSLPQFPSGVGPRASGPGAGVGAPMPAMPMMPRMPMEQMELKPTQDTTNLLGYVCTRYELKRRGEVMEIWATDKLLPFQPYLQNQPARFGPNTMEEQWGRLLEERRLFPLLAILRTENPTASAEGGPPVAGPERLRFEVKSITPETITDETLFQPPQNYHEIQPLPF